MGVIASAIVNKRPRVPKNALMAGVTSNGGTTMASTPPAAQSKCPVEDLVADTAGLDPFWLGHASGKCHCTSDAVARYQDRISGPLLDRIDMQIEVAAMSPESMSALADGELTDSIAARAAHAYSLQL